MVDVAQLVRAPVCGTGGRGFESHLPPHLFNVILIYMILGCSQAVRHQTLTLACASSNLASPAKKNEILKISFFIIIFYYWYIMSYYQCSNLFLKFKIFYYIFIIYLKNHIKILWVISLFSDISILSTKDTIIVLVISSVFTKSFINLYLYILLFLPII